jgi:Holliday junction resolvase RusA-like endonuclease
MQFVIPIKAIPKGRARDFNFHTPERTRDFEERFRFELLQILHRLPYKFEPFTGRLDMTLEFLPASTIVCIKETEKKRRKGIPVGDVDNLCKAVLDSCQADEKTGWKGLFANDSQIDSLWGKR